MWSVDIVQEIGNKGIYVNVKGKNGEMHLYLKCGNNIVLILCMVFNLLFTSFLSHRS
jgi:hypothetical protein